MVGGEKEDVWGGALFHHSCKAQMCFLLLLLLSWMHLQGFLPKPGGAFMKDWG